MSYGYLNNCNGCKRLKTGCKDSQKIQDGVTAIHQSFDGSHQGYGNVKLECNNKLTEDAKDEK